MAVQLRHHMFGQLGSLRYEPTDKRIRAELDGRTIVDSRRALLVWEPKRVVPSYAVPLDDVTGEIDPDRSPEAVTPAGIAAIGAPQLGDRVVLDPSVPFQAHTADGAPVLIRTGTERTPAGFRPSDPDLDGYVVLDFEGFDEWYEEEERNVGHPRDPFHRVDVLR